MRLGRNNRLTAWFGRWGRLALFASAVLAAALLHLGCSKDPVERYHTLSTFFDGVPVPEELQGQPGFEAPLSPREAAERAAAQGNQAQTVEYFYHAPYARRECFGCHDRERGYEKMVGGDNLVCRRCHQTYFERETYDWVHGPVVLGECQRCHEPHKSEYDHLLDSPQPGLCFNCHSADWIDGDSFHQTLEDRTCSRCHDPHAAGNRKLLADSRTYQRRRGAGLTAVSEHPEWSKDQCAMCHQTEQANVLVADVDRVCLTCHQPMVDAAGPGLPQAVADGRCTACHTPHKSPRPNLIHPTAEKVCLTCHKLDELKPAHPKVTRVDCLMCHAGHKASRPYLLRNGISPVADASLSPRGGDATPGGGGRP